ncbi:MAG: hypothetical protein JSS75_05960 [Bacteroidetes bacterium]|nr:hypothetical protein [Bacteroidota bacterium]
MNDQNGKAPAEVSTDQLNNLVESTTELVKKYDSTGEAVHEELAQLNSAIDTWEKLSPKLYMMRKRLTLIDEILTGKRSVDSLTGVQIGKAAKVVAEKTKKKKAFIKRKSEILTDSVIEEIRDYIAQDDEYKKAKDIYKYLRKHELIPAFNGDSPERTFSIALSRVDQDLIMYNAKPSIMAWGLKDFGSDAHERRKALKGSVRNEAGTKVFSH